MICHPKRELRLFLILIIITVFIFQRCFSVSLAPRENDSAGLRGVSAGGESPVHGQQGLSHAVKQVTWTPSWDLFSLSGLLELQPGFKTPANSLPPVGELKPDKTRNSLNLSSSMWTTGKVREEGRSAAQGFKQGYQADFTGFSVIQGKVLGLSSDSSPYFSEWEAMRPLVKCADDSMTFHASGQGFTHLQVDRKRASPISIFQLPSYCSYVVKASRTDLEMMVPYDDCYIIQENGSHVLPMLWLGISLRLSCPITASTVIPMYSLPAPTVFCSADSMAVQVQRQEHSLPVLGVIVAGTKDPFVSERCAFQVDSEAQKLTYLISNSAPCITTDDGLHLHLTLDDLLYVLSCPVSSQIPYAPSLPQYQPFSHGDPLPLNLPHLISPVPTSTPNPLRQASGNEQSIENPHYQKYYSGFQYQQLPQTSPGALQTLQPTIESIRQYRSGSEPLGSNPRYLSHHFQFKDNSAHELPDSPSQDPYPAFYTYVPFFHQDLNPAVDDHHKPPAGPYYPQYYHQKHHYPVYTVTPVTQAPAPLSGLSFLHKGPLNPQHHSDPFNPMSFYHQQALSYSASHPVAAPPSGNPDNPIYPTSQSNIQTPFQFLLPPHLLLVNQESKKPLASHDTFYPANYHKLHPLFPHYPKAASPTVTPKSISPEKSIIKCLEKNMVAFLPFADPNTIQIKDPLMSWESISSASPFCGYMLQMTGGLGVILHSPLPACHSHLQTPTTISLPIRYWDFSTQQNRTLDLECPYQITPDTPTSTPWDFPTPPSTTQGKPGPSVVTMTEVFCSFQQMKVVLPLGAISEIVLKDTDGNQMSLHESPKECGYYASEAKDGKIHLFLQLHSHCHMSVQDQMYIISILYTTPSGRKEAKVSCPIVNPRSEHECNLHSEYRLPCGSSSISQTQCLSMGCCFNKHPPACYYPMDECTIDRHMIFSVPASLTDPPLSTALLVAANNSTCKPQRVTPEYALFNIPMDGCGTRRVMMGKTVVYMVEITNIVQTVSLNYGTITRDSPIRLLVECRYVPGTALSVSYVVKTPTFGPEVHTQGVFGVQLRIAKDSQYSSYYPQYHQPLHMLLGKPLHLEVRLLNSPDPSLVLLVHFCVAYPRSGKAVWVLLYNGCPNPLDPAPPKTVLSEPTPPSQSQTRRFTIRTFQFLPDGDFQDTDEEIYFMCSTEICSPRDGPCVEGCFGQ